MSPNLIKDKSFRSNRVLREPAWELNEVVLSGLRAPEQQSLHRSSASLDESKARNELNISLKVFLKDFDLDKAKEAIDTALSVIGTEYVEELHLALPQIAAGILGFPAPEADSDHKELNEVKGQLLELWRFFEKLVDIKVIKNLGISDCETEVFKYLYEGAKIKPTIPPELNSFAMQIKSSSLLIMILLSFGSHPLSP
ncbi:Glutamate--cysteine ligase regulatory subunit [Caligus rogercresseyi]|uniref:GCS light chain n=1 Tax=Caligus rogercresseyi TaxID=217165 RepID=A0A7T8KHZ5_CALRO|nr:Glutamate--cysteine ligase regulatory subunit [Caligus rogercresseyi]